MWEKTIHPPEKALIKDCCFAGIWFESKVIHPKCCTHAIITRSWFETALDTANFIEELPCLVHKLFVILTVLIINRSEKWVKKFTSHMLISDHTFINEIVQPPRLFRTTLLFGPLEYLGYGTLFHVSTKVTIIQNPILLPPFYLIVLWWIDKTCVLWIR